MSPAIALPRHKLSVTDYHQMITTGILTGEDHVELIDGDLIEMAPAGPEHADFVAYLGRILRTQTVLLVREEKPVTLPEHSEPEPDIALVKPRRYLETHPYPEDVLMISRSPIPASIRTRASRCRSMRDSGSPKSGLSVCREAQWNPSGSQGSPRSLPNTPIQSVSSAT